MFPYMTRDLAEALRVWFIAYERQVRQYRFATDGFEMYPLPIKKWKMYTKRRNLDELDFIVTHVTAVEGGFGVSKRRVRHWLKQLKKGVLSDALRHQLAKAGPFFSSEDRLLAAKRLALWERYRAGVPYHQIGAANGDNIACRELRHVTWHANLGNFGVGCAFDVAAHQDLEDWHIETGRAALRTLCSRTLLVSEKARLHGIRCAPHRAFSPSRRRDTSANVHREIVIPVSKELPCLDIDYTIKKGRGLPIPVDWDPVALYDSRGRLL